MQVGPLLLAPLSEIYGRRVVLSSANWFFVVWQIGCALSQNIESVIICRLFAGIGGSGCLTLGAGVVADLFPREQRGKATSIWALGPVIGPVVGPIAGGFLGEVSWRWIFWLLLITSGTMQLAIELLNKETYAPVLIKWKTAKMNKELGRTDLISAYEVGLEPASPGQILTRSLKRPILLFFKSPIVLLLSTYMVRFPDPTSPILKGIQLIHLRPLCMAFYTSFSPPSQPYSPTLMASLSGCQA